METATSTPINDNDCPRFRPFASPTQRMIKVKKAKYSTSLDPRGYIPVYEYLINGQPIMWDRESGYVHFTGIWKSLGNSKADIVKMVDSNPELKVKKIRGGFLKIQGTWIPYEYAYILCKRTAWVVRKDLVAIFGPRFVNDALDPSHPEYGCLLLDPSQKGSSLRRNSFTTMRQSSNHPYKRDFMRNSKTTATTTTTTTTTTHEKPTQTILPRQNKYKAISNMSLSRLLNNQSSDGDSSDQEDSMQHSKAFITGSPSTTPSPTFRVVPTFDTANKWSDPTTRLLPPIYTSTSDQYPLKPSESEPRITPVYSPTWSPVSPISSEDSSSSTPGHAKDIIDTINATILLQRLSQDDGARPFKPMHPDSIPSKVMVGNQEFRICWNN
ncbi:transcription regulator HTH, apses-type DNA-binding domain-containing protein [Thamnidium elegans]|nr:transcription regulator HTH, apses-type DNA-binding domain-containing protein [Thamnidium elegans]